MILRLLVRAPKQTECPLTEMKWGLGLEETRAQFGHINIKIHFKHLDRLIHKSGFQGRNLEIQISELEEIKCCLKP